MNDPSSLLLMGVLILVLVGVGIALNGTLGRGVRQLRQLNEQLGTLEQQRRRERAEDEHRRERDAQREQDAEDRRIFEHEQARADDEALTRALTTRDQNMNLLAVIGHVREVKPKPSAALSPAGAEGHELGVEALRAELLSALAKTAEPKK